MGKFRESQTALNLQASFAAETQARTRYDFFADRAQDEGFIQIAKLFKETADQEFEHALRFFKFFNGGHLPVNWSFPSGVIQNTHANLLSSAELEHYVSYDMYAGFAQDARKEGFERAADTFEAIIVSENYHEQLFLHLADNIDKDNSFSRKEEQKWRCLGCGYIHLGKRAPDKCPGCVKPQGYFEILCENY
ncbi:MAG: rubrerythrin family protein [Desulfobacter sp.]|nr:rubrerythrin family protein [Desulfobacter sp.]WDP87642.1 MAG: rubrerythrin family protein [Desulfobacter sp.]